MYNMPSPFLDGFKLTSNLPEYRAFKGTFIEKFDLPIVRLLIDNADISEEQKELLEVLYGNCLRYGHNKVEHKQPYGVGRFYPADEANKPSIIQFKRIIKHTIQKYSGWIDIDMVKSHLNIVYQVAIKNKMEGQAKQIKNYIENTDEVIKSVIDYYAYYKHTVTEDDVKELYRSGINGGSVKGWLNARNIDCCEMIMLQDYIKECRVFMDFIYMNNLELAEKVKGKLTDPWDIKKRCCYYWCCVIENEALHISYKYLVDQKIIKKAHVALEYDGFCFEPNSEIPDDICEILNEKVFNKLKLGIKFSIKGYKDTLDDIIKLRNEYKAPERVIETFHDINNYEEFKEWFELTHAKIINKEMFVKNVTNEDGTKMNITFKEEGLKKAYRHYTYEVINENTGIPQTKSYVEKWLLDPYIKSYDDIGIYPPPLKCPSHIYNAWTPFRMESIYDSIPLPDENSEEFKKIMDDVNFLQNHIKILCSNESNENTEVSDYILKWIGQSLKYPSLKTTAPCLISDEGSGKGTLIKVMKKLMGNNKVLETTQPDRDIWGSFNSVMLNLYFISLNEMELHLQEKAEGVIKGLITDGDLMINSKGKDQVLIKSYHRFWFASNKEAPIKSKKGDRRNLIVRCSDVLKGNSDYFTKINEIIENDVVMKVFYNCLINIPDLDKFHRAPLPITDYQEAIQDANRSIIDLWLEKYVLDNYYETEVIETSNDLYTKFNSWKNKNGFEKYDTNSIKFGRALQLAKLPPDCIINHKQDSTLHTNKGNKYKFNIKNLRNHYKFNDITFEEEP